ncbi:HAD-IIB family hydrolase [Streptomyces lydicus]
MHARKGGADQVPQMDQGMPFVFDVDGTTCFDGTQMPPEIVEAITRCRAARPILFASARPIRDLIPVLPTELADVPLIGGNGAFTRSDGHIEVTKFSDSVRRSINEIIDRYALEYLIDSSWDYSFQVTREREILERVDQGGLAKRAAREELPEYAKVVLFGAGDAALTELTKLGVTINIHQSEDLVDLSPKAVDKATALFALNVPAGEYVAFGNDQNDLRMFESAAYSVCVGTSEVGKLADRVITRADVGTVIDELSGNIVADVVS